MPLTTLLRLNSASCLGAGLLFLAVPRALASWLGAMPVWLLVAVGAGLVVHAAHLLLVARRGPAPWEVRYFSTADALWVAATVAILASGAWITTPAGIAVAALVAVIVGVLGALQWQSLALAATPRAGGA